MQLTQQLKKNIARTLKHNFEARVACSERYTAKAHSHWLDINNSVHHQILRGKIDGILSEGEWIRVGMILLYDFDNLDWKVANTITHRHIKQQLQGCMQHSIGATLADDSSIGKSFTAQRFALYNPNVAYVDCSRVSKYSDLLRALCQSFGLPKLGKLSDLRRQLVEHIMTLDKPLIILDEAGDLNDRAELQLKGLWNELEYMCGWYKMGANGLRAKLENKLSWNKVGYEENFNRLGNKIQAITENMTAGEKDIFKRKQIEAVIKLNAPSLTDEARAQMIAACNGNLRRVRTEILKLKNQLGSHAA